MTLGYICLLCYSWPRIYRSNGQVENMVALYSLHTYFKHMGQEGGAQKEATHVFVINIQTNSVPVANVTFAKNLLLG